MSLIKSILLAALLMATAVAQGNKDPPAQDPAAAVESSDTPAVDTPDGAHGTIIFFRPRKMLGAAAGFKVREKGVELGKLRNGTYFALKVAPGSHQYVVHSEAEDVLTMEVEAGETYYVQGTLGMGIVAGRPNLAPSDQATFESMKAKLKEKAPLTGEDGEPGVE